MFTGLAALAAAILAGWAVIQNKGLKKGQEAHEKAAVARNRMLIGEVEEGCDEGVEDHGHLPSRRRR